MLLTISVFEFFGPIVRDTSVTHLLNPEWVGHARFHLAWALVFMGLSGLCNLYLIWFRRPYRISSLYLSWVWQACNVLGFWGAAAINSSPLLDYEVEMGFVLLEDIDPSQLDNPSFAPRLGYFIANDLSARSIAILGEGRPNRFEYWGASKSFAGFMPIGDRAWVPAAASPSGIPCVEIEALVDGEVRQLQSTNNMIYTPVDMLRFIHAAFPDAPLSSRTIVLTGTPGGVAMQSPRWLVRLGDLVGMSRFNKLSAKLAGDRSRFLEIGDRVTVRGQGLGNVTVTIGHRADDGTSQ